MTKWEVYLQAVVHYTVEVEAENEDDAKSKALVTFTAATDTGQYEDGYDDPEATEAYEIIKM